MPARGLYRASGMLSFGALRAWVPLVGRGLLWTFALAVFAHLGGATWHHRDGHAPRARWGLVGACRARPRRPARTSRRDRPAAIQLSDPVPPDMLDPTEFAVGRGF
ncbi:MAG: hypothetical protein AAGA56_07435 [Myxococcota bacterium]